MDDEDARAIRLRRAQLVSAALACLVGCGDDVKDHAKPTVCLSFSHVCPKGSEAREGVRPSMTERPNVEKECVPIGSPSSISAARARESAKAAESATPSTSSSAEPTRSK